MLGFESEGGGSGGVDWEWGFVAVGGGWGATLWVAETRYNAIVTCTRSDGCCLQICLCVGMGFFASKWSNWPDSAIK